MAALHRAIAVTITVIFALASHVVAEEKPRIGVPVSLTGPGALVGQLVRDTIRFANDELAQGKYEIVLEDDRCDGKLAATAASKLIAVDKVRASIGSCSSSILAAASIYDRNKILAIALATHPRIAGLSPYVYRTFPSDEEGGRLIGSYVDDRFKRLAVISEQKDFPLGFAAALRDSVKAAAISSFEEFPSAETDFTTLLTLTRKGEPDVLAVFTQDEAALLRVVRTVRSQQWEVPLIAAYFPSSPTFLKEAGPLAEGIVFASLPSMASFGESGHALLARFAAKYGPIKTVPHVFFYAYDAFAAAHTAISAGAQDVPAFMRSTTFTGSHGQFTFDKAGSASGIHLSLSRVENGKVVPVETLREE